jgi:hypothetical protein
MCESPSVKKGEITPDCGIGPAGAIGVVWVRVAVTDLLEGLGHDISKERVQLGPWRCKRAGARSEAA